MKKILLISSILCFVFGFARLSFGDALLWDDPGINAWANITGFNIYFTGAGNNYSNTVTKAELRKDAGKVIYDDMENKLNIQYGVEYSLYITAYNDSGESGPSNTITFTRESYLPPLPSLPVGEVVSLPQSPGGLGVE